MVREFANSAKFRRNRQCNGQKFRKIGNRERIRSRRNHHCIGDASQIVRDFVCSAKFQRNRQCMGYIVAQNRKSYENSYFRQVSEFRRHRQCIGWRFHKFGQSFGVSQIHKHSKKLSDNSQIVNRSSLKFYKTSLVESRDLAKCSRSMCHFSWQTSKMNFEFISIEAVAAIRQNQWGTDFSSLLCHIEAKRKAFIEVRNNCAFVRMFVHISCRAWQIKSSTLTFT